MSRSCQDAWQCGWHVPIQRRKSTRPTTNLGHPSHIVAFKVDEHRMLGAFLWVAQEIWLESAFLFFASSARTGPGDGTYGMDGDAPFMDGDALFIKVYALLMEGYALLMEVYALLMEGYALLMEGHALLMEGDALFMEGDALFMEGDALFMEGDTVFIDGDVSFIERDAPFMKRDAYNIVLAIMSATALPTGRISFLRGPLPSLISPIKPLCSIVSSSACKGADGT